MFRSVHHYALCMKTFNRFDTMFQMVLGSKTSSVTSTFRVDQFTDFNVLAQAMTEYLDHLCEQLDRAMKSFNSIAKDKDRLRFVVLFRFQNAISTQSLSGPGKPVFCYIAWNRGKGKRRIEPVKHLFNDKTALTSQPWYLFQ